MVRSAIGALLLSTCVVLSGCSSLIPRPVQDGCRMTMKTAGGFKLGSLVVPLGKLAPGQTLKLNGVEYGPAEAYQLTEAAQNLEQVRLMSCGILASPALQYASQHAVDKAIGAAMTVLNAIATYSKDLEAAKTQQAGVQAAQNANREAAEVPKQIPPELKSASPALFDPTPLNTDIALVRAEVASTVQQLSSQIQTLQGQVAQFLKTPSLRRIEVAAFAPASAEIPAQARESLASSFRAALAGFDPDRTPVVTIIGYADRTGNYTSNIRLTLRRASAVSDFLKRQRLGRDFESHVTTGGVLAGGREARRVDIIIS